MELKSQLLKEFIREITERNRNPRDLRALEVLDEDESNSTIVLLKDTVFYRARSINKKDKRIIGKEANFWGFNAKDSGVPPKEKTSDMRANYRNIPYLYGANNAYIATIEVRPRLGSMVSVATIRVDEELTILDFTAMNNPPKKMSEAKRNLFHDLSVLYSEPVTETDDTIDYIPTQFIAEYVKNLGYDGIAFNSSLAPELNDAPVFNVVIFNYEKTTPIKSNIIHVSNEFFGLEQIDEDEDELDVRSWIEQQLDDIIGNKVERNR